MSMDISMKPVIGSRIYHYDEVGIRGVLANEILATVLSRYLVFRRAKDLVDVYALTHCITVNTAEIFEVIASKNLALGNFTELLTRREDIEHTYNKLTGIDGKPPFDEVYPYLRKYVAPFAQKDKTLRIWNDGQQAWKEQSI